MKKSFILCLSITFFLLGMFFQARRDYKEFRQRSLVLAQNSFEGGCLFTGTEDCMNHNVGDDDFDVWMRNNCLQSVIDNCHDKSLNFSEWLSDGGLNEGEGK
jgi:hypothetical protein